jgi:hypothetical protein
MLCSEAYKDWVEEYKLSCSRVLSLPQSKEESRGECYLGYESQLEINKKLVSTPQRTSPALSSEGDWREILNT